MHWGFGGLRAVRSMDGLYDNGVRSPGFGEVSGTVFSIDGKGTVAAGADLHRSAPDTPLTF